jgi:hypothetical protein
MGMNTHKRQTTSKGTSVFSKSTEVSSILGLDGLKWNIPRPFAKKRVPLVINCIDDRRDDQDVWRMNDKTNANFTNHRNDDLTTSHHDLMIPGNLKSKSKSNKSKKTSRKPSTGEANMKTSRKPSTGEANKKTSQKPSTGEANELGLLCCLGPFCADYDTDSVYICSTITSTASTGVDGDDTSQPGQYLYHNDDISDIIALSSSGDESNEYRAAKDTPSNNAVEVNMMPAAPRRLRKQQQQLQKQREVRFAAEQVQMKAREVEAAQKQFDVLMKQAKEAKRQAEESAKKKIMRERALAVVAEKRYETELARRKQENDREIKALKAKLAKARRTQRQQDIKNSKGNGSVFTSSAFTRKTVAYTDLASLKKSWTLSTGSSSRQREVSLYSQGNRAFDTSSVSEQQQHGNQGLKRSRQHTDEEK